MTSIRRATRIVLSNHTSLSQNLKRNKLSTGSACANLAQQVIQRRSFHASSKAEAPPLSQQTIEVVKATAPVLAEHGYAITRNMYGRMLKDPKIAALFNPSHQIEQKGQKAYQPWSLACAVHAYAANVDNLEVLGEAVERIAQKHVSLQVLPEHHPVVAENVLWSIKHTLGDAATPQIMDAWKEAIVFLADIFINRENQIRDEKAKQAGGWLGFRKFVVDKKVKESSEIMSLYMKPKDGGSLLAYKPGCYTAVEVTVDGVTTHRNYTLSKPSGDDGVWRITVKREPASIEGAPVGRVSAYLHDEIKEGDSIGLAVPCGDFFLEASDKPYVLISGGVGLTPLLAMLEHLVDSKAKNNIFMINSAKSPETEAMHDLLAKYRRKHLNLVIKTLYDEGPDAYPKSPVSMEQLDMTLPTRDCQYYFCGPPAMMNSIHKGLKDEWNIPKEQIHFEFFGPTTA